MFPTITVCKMFSLHGYITLLHFWGEEDQTSQEFHLTNLTKRNALEKLHHTAWCISIQYKCIMMKLSMQSWNWIINMIDYIFILTTTHPKIDEENVLLYLCWPFVLDTTLQELKISWRKEKWEMKREVVLWLHLPTSRDWHKIPNVGVKSCHQTKTKCHKEQT